MSAHSIPSRSCPCRFKASFLLFLLSVVALPFLYSTPATARMLQLSGAPGMPRLSPDGSTVVTQNDLGEGHAGKWTEASGWISLGALSGSQYHSSARATSNNGSVIVGISTSAKAPYGWEAFRWSNGTMSSIGLGVATDVSANGRTIVGKFTSGSRTGIVWRQGIGGITQPFTLPSNIASVDAEAVSRDGTTIVGVTYNPSAPHYQIYGGFYWSPFDGLHLFRGIPLDISGDGSIFVGYRFDDSGQVEIIRWEKKRSRSGITFSETRIGDRSMSIHAECLRISGNGKVIIYCDKVWTKDAGIQSVEQYLHGTFKSATGGWSSLRATDISDDGKVIVGTGSAGAWLADDTPEPTTYLLLHGLNSSPGTWDKLVKNEFNNNCQDFDITEIVFSSLSKNKRCYRYHFRARIVDGRVWENGDGATYSQLGSEVRAAMNAVEKATRPGAVVIVGHSRGGLAARAFLQSLPGRLTFKVGLLTIGTPHQGSPLGRIKHFMDALGYRPEDTISKFRFLWSPSSGDMATAHDALERPVRTSISEPIWSLNDNVHRLDGVTDVLGQIDSKGLILGENAVLGFNLLDGTSMAGVLPGDFTSMRSYVLSNLMLPGVFECDDNDRQDENHWACNGDGIVPRISQRLSNVPGFEQGTRKDIWNNVVQQIPHTSETEMTNVIAAMLENMTNQVGFQRFSLH